MSSAGGTRKRRRADNMPPVPQNTAFAAVVGAVVGAGVGGLAGACMGMAIAAAWSNGSLTLSRQRDRKRAKHGHNTSRDAEVARQLQRDWDQEVSLRRSEQVLSDHNMAKQMARADEKSPADGGHHAGARSVGRASSGRGDLARDKHGHAAKRLRVRDIDRHPHERTVHVFIMSENAEILMLHHTKSGTWQLPGGESEPDDDTIFETAERETAEELGTYSHQKAHILQRLKHLKDSRRAKMQVVSSGVNFVNIAVIVPCKTLTQFMDFFRLPGRNKSIQDRMYNTKLSKEHSGYCFVRLADLHRTKKSSVKVHGAKNRDGSDKYITKCEVKVHGAKNSDGSDKYITMQCQQMYNPHTIDDLQRMAEVEVSFGREFGHLP